MRSPLSRLRTLPQLVGLEARDVPASFSVNSLSETPVTGKVTLREALATAAANGEDDTVFLDSGLGGQTVTLTKGVFTLGETGKTLELSFSDASPPTLDANKLSQVFVVPAGATASVTGLKLVNGKGDKGGAVSNAGALTLQRVTITDSESTGDGGGVFTDTGSNLTVSGCSITDNQAGGTGAASGISGPSSSWSSSRWWSPTPRPGWVVASSVGTSPL